MGTENMPDLTRLLDMYSELVLSMKSKFPKTDLKFLLELMSHEFLHPDHTPTVQLEIFYKKGVDLHSKSDHFSVSMDRVPSIYSSEDRLVIEPRLRLKDLEELSKDPDIESLGGDVYCCIDTLLSRRKKMV
jgi:hypothetical protein